MGQRMADLVRERTRRWAALPAEGREIDVLIHRLLAAEPETRAGALDAVLAELGDLVLADRLTVYRLRAGQFERARFWQAAPEALTDEPTLDLPRRLRELLAHGKTTDGVYCTVDGNNTEAQSYSRVLVPILHEGVLAGVVAFDSLSMPSSWSHGLEDELVLLARAIGLAMGRPDGGERLAPAGAGPESNADGGLVWWSSTLWAQRPIRREGRQVLVMVVEMQGFGRAEVADPWAASEGVLQELGGRIRGELGEAAHLARLAPRQLLLAVDGSSGEAAPLVARIAALIEARPFEVEGALLSLESAIGAAAGRGERLVALVSEAERALEEAREQGGWLLASSLPPRRWDGYDPTLALEVRRALASDQLRLFLQPRVWLATDTLAGAEALVRWRHPQRGLLQAATFLPLLAGSSLRCELNRWVLSGAVELLERFPWGGWFLSINLSRRDLVESERFLAVMELLVEHASVASRLEIEIGLSGPGPQDLETVGRRLRELKRQLPEVRLALDHFGVPGVAVGSLHHLPVDCVKLDPSLIAALAAGDPSARALVRAAASLGAELGQVVVAVGVEDAKTAQTVFELGCTQAQGFHFGRPLPVAEFEALVEDPIEAQRACKAS
jgi:EAL domain-containing protein (putative c-di-GMP-specific phosphodiesterase class I)